jgi:hypothetical protein
MPRQAAKLVDIPRRIVAGRQGEAKMATSAPEPTRGNQRSIPDIEFIKRHVPIADVARALDIRVVGNAAHCWRPENHEHRDRTPSVWFSRRSNKGKCMVCDRFTWSTVDLVQAVLGCGTAAAINWIADRFNVPRIAKRRPVRNGIVVPAGRVGLGSPAQQLMRSGLFAKLTHATKVLLFVLTEFCDDHQTVSLSYRTLQRVSGIGSLTTIKESLDNLEDMGLLKVKRARGGHGPRAVNGYRITWDDAGLQRLMCDTHESTSREVKAEKELREAARAAAAPIPRYYSLHSVEHEKRSVFHSLEQLTKEAKAPKPETLGKRRGATA